MTLLIDPPMAIDVSTNEDGVPTHIRGHPLIGPVRPVQRWLAEVDWWDRPVSREYWRVLLLDRLLCEIYRDRALDAWFLDRVYD